jgi:hypothetical protein
MFTNTNYESKLSPTMTENWLVQIFKNNATSVLTTATPNLTDKDDADYNLRFSFSGTTYNGYDYYPAILNKPSISYSLDLKGFTTKTGNITLNIANIDLDGTTLLELLGSEFVNGHVNVLSQIDGDDTANNALQIFSGKVSSFGYRNNTIVLNVISNRPFQNVSIPQGRSSADNPQYNNKIVPLVYGDYTPNTNFVSGTDVYACPFLKNDGKDFMYIVPEGTDGADTAKLEFYDKGLKRFLELINTDTTIATEDNVSVLKVPKLMRRQFKMLPDEIPGGVTKQEGSGSGVIAVTFPNGDGTINNAFDGSTDSEVDINHATNFADIRGFTLKLKMPQVSGKITDITLGLDGTLTQAYSSGSPGVDDGLFVNLATELDSGFGSTTPSKHIAIIGTSSNYSRTTSFDLTASYNAVDISGILTDNALPDELFLSFRWDTANGNVDCNSFNVSLENVFVTVTAENDLANEPIASQDFNAGIDKLYLGRDITTPGFYQHTTASEINELNNPVSIHRQLLYAILNNDDLDSDTKVENSGFKTVAELRDSKLTAPTSTHWETQLSLDEKESLESIMEQLQYEGCFFFEFSPQAQQELTGVAKLRYFTIEDSVTANVDLSQNDISGYELGITSVQDLETSMIVNYKPHPAENEYLEQYTYPATFSGSNHQTIFGDQDIQKQEVNLDLLYSSVDEVVGSRNSSWINFRESIFGDYKTTVNATLVNPEKYGMLQVGDYIDFGEITFEELGSPFNEISDTFDSFVAMPTRLFKDAWSGKKFIITNLKRQVGKVSVQCREV